MKRALSVTTLITYLLINYIGSQPASAQNFTPYVGFHGGVNLSHPSVQQSFHIITLLDDQAPILSEYTPVYQNLGNQLGFSLILDFNDHLGLALLPQQGVYNYSYAFSVDFYDSQNTAYSRTETESHQRLSYINLPLIFRYIIIKSKWSPFLFGGTAYGILRSASGDVNVTITQLIDNTVEITPIPNGEDQVFIRSKISLLAGAGVLYDLEQVQIGLDLAYWYGLHNITHEANRFNNQISSGGAYDVPSDIKLHHYALNLSVLFPINKLNNMGSLDCIPIKK